VCRCALVCIRRSRATYRYVLYNHKENECVAAPG
jgi:hypothetical protein